VSETGRPEDRIPWGEIIPEAAAALCWSYAERRPHWPKPCPKCNETITRWIVNWIEPAAMKVARARADDARTTHATHAD
jgi:hypothetical protein